VYLYRLIKDIDDPFEYSRDGRRGSSEVALFPLTDYLQRLDNRNAARPASSRTNPRG
jgi:hypothetical protein